MVSYRILTPKINNNSTAITNLTNRLNGKEFIKNKTPNYDINLRYEKKAGEDKFSLHAYNGNTEIPLASQDSGISIIHFEYNNTRWYKLYSNGWLEQGGVSHTQEFEFLVPFKDMNYQIVFSPMNDDNTSGTMGWSAWTVSRLSLQKIRINWYYSMPMFSWYACGWSQ